MASEAAMVKGAVGQQLRAGDAWYLVSQKWWDGWSAFSGYGPPGSAGAAAGKPLEISNEDLLDVQTSGPGMPVLRPDVRENVDYALVPESAWNHLHGIYGGGPALRREVVVRGYEESIERYPLIVTVATLLDGSVDESSKQVRTVSREVKFSVAMQTLCAGTDASSATLWVNRKTNPKGVEDVMKPAVLRSYEPIKSDADDSVGDLMITDGSILLVELNSLSTAFEPVVRRAAGSENWVDPAALGGPPPPSPSLSLSSSSSTPGPSPLSGASLRVLDGTIWLCAGAKMSVGDRVDLNEDGVAQVRLDSACQTESAAELSDCARLGARRPN